MESNRLVLTKPCDITNHFNDFYVSKVSQLRQGMHISNNIKSNGHIKNIIMEDKGCVFEFHEVEINEVERLLHSLPERSKILNELRKGQKAS